MKTIVIIPALDPKDKMIILVKALLKLDFTETANGLKISANSAGALYS